MDSEQLEQHYRRYISQLNAKKTDDLDLNDYVHDEVTHNGRRMSRSEYGAMIASSITAAPDLFFDVHLLVANDDQVAARINFNCTPVAELNGKKPTGDKVAFSEHAFYQFEDGKIREVWALFDEPAPVAAAAGAPPPTATATATAAAT
ncbi:hypothetical protein BC567DRAFT_222050 [Phyllosticta citribraziliensis]